MLILSSKLHEIYSALLSITLLWEHNLFWLWKCHRQRLKTSGILSLERMPGFSNAISKLILSYEEYQIFLNYSNWNSHMAHQFLTEEFKNKEKVVNKEVLFF